MIKELKKKDRQVQEEDKVIYINEKIYIPRNQQVHEEILKNNHNLPDIGHPGQQRMIELIKKNYQQLGICNDI